MYLERLIGEVVNIKSRLQYWLVKVRPGSDVTNLQLNIGYYIINFIVVRLRVLVHIQRWPSFKQASAALKFTSVQTLRSAHLTSIE